jgi:O-antigen/teichoic acid export membrane protein
MFIAWILASAMMPMYSYLSETSTPSLRVSFEKSVKFMLVLLVPISVILFAGADGLIRVIYGQEQFAPSIGTLQLLAFAIVFYGVSHLSGSFLLSRGAGREFVWATATAALLNIALSLILIPRFSLEGAAAATLLSEFLLALVGLILAQRTLGRLRWVGIASGAISAGTVMAAVMLVVPRPVWLSLGIGPIVYVALLAAFEVRTFREDADIVRGVVRRGLVRPPS